jgi:hypothetical protein
MLWFHIPPYIILQKERKLGRLYWIKYQFFSRRFRDVNTLFYYTLLNNLADTNMQTIIKHGVRMPIIGLFHEYFDKNAFNFPIIFSFDIWYTYLNIRWCNSVQVWKCCVLESYPSQSSYNTQSVETHQAISEQEKPNALVRQETGKSKPVLACHPTRIKHYLSLILEREGRWCMRVHVCVHVYVRVLCVCVLAEFLASEVSSVLEGFIIFQNQSINNSTER